MAGGRWAAAIVPPGVADVRRDDVGIVDDSMADVGMGAVGMRDVRLGDVVWLMWE